MPTPSEYQAKMLAAYYASIPKLQRENRRLKQIIVILLIVGTVQWALQWM